MNDKEFFYNACSKEQIDKFESGEYIETNWLKELFVEKVKEFRNFCEKDLQLIVNPGSAYFLYGDLRKHTLNLSFIRPNGTFNNYVSFGMLLNVREDKIFTIIDSLYLIEIVVGGHTVYTNSNESFKILKAEFEEWLNK